MKQIPQFDGYVYVGYAQSLGRFFTDTPELHESSDVDIAFGPLEELPKWLSTDGLPNTVTHRAYVSWYDYYEEVDHANLYYRPLSPTELLTGASDE